MAALLVTKTNLPFGVILALVLAAGAAARKTALGLFVEAVGDHETASRFSGLSTRAVRLFACSFTGF